MSQTGAHNSIQAASGEHLLTQTPRLLFLKKKLPCGLNLEGSLGPGDIGSSCPFLPRVCGLARRLYTQGLLHGFVHHIADATCRQYLQ